MSRRSLGMRVRKLLGRGDDRPGSISDELDQLTPEDRAIVEGALPHTMTGVHRLAALVEAVRYCVRRGIEGDFAECGVWRGGSVLAMILALGSESASPRTIHLYDTFEGMTKPSRHDVSGVEPPALEAWRDAQRRGDRPWGELFDPRTFNEGAVRELLLGAGYPAERLHLVAGPVEETIPGHLPDRLALLRLDTDWYESTRHELEHLYPRLVEGGVLIVDDYGHWHGCRQAVDEYFATHAPPLLLNRIDYTGRIAVKL